MLIVHIQLYLGTIVLLTVLNELLRCRGKLVLLGQALEAPQLLDELLLGGLLPELYENRSGMAVQDRYADTLGTDHRLCCCLDVISLDVSPNLQRLLLGLLLLTADVRDDVAHHLRPGLEILAGTGNGLVGGNDHLIGLKLHPCGQRRCIGLNGTVGLYSDEASCGAQTLLLLLDDLVMLGIDLRYHHRNVLGPAMCRVVGHHRCLCPGIGLLDHTDLVLLHVYRREYEIHVPGHALDVRHILHDHVLHLLRHGDVQLPSALYGLAVGLSCRPG